MRFVSGRSRLPANPDDISQRFQIMKVDRVREFRLIIIKILIAIVISYVHNLFKNKYIAIVIHYLRYSNSIQRKRATRMASG